MKIKNFTKQGLLVLAAILLIGGSLFYVLRITDKNDTNPQNGPNAQEKKLDDAVNAELKRQVIEDDKGSKPPSNPPASSSIEITSRQESNNTVTLFTKLIGYSNGTCDLTVINSEKTYAQSATVIYQDEFSSCAGFSVPISSLGKGRWEISLKVTSNGLSETKTHTVEVR
jgi:hypothetical protein